MAYHNRYKYDSSGLQQFPYYSGSQISIWFGDIWVDDIISMEWTYSQNKKPLYGYASQYFDAVAEGQVMIEGSFVINFREKGYITYVIQNLKRIFKDLKAMKSAGQIVETDFRAVKEAISVHLKNGTFGPTTFTEIEELAKGGDFFEKAKLYEDVIWGSPEQEKANTGYVETPDVLQHQTLPEGFDILISYGDVGAVKDYAIEDMYSSTAKTLNGAHLVGTAQVIEVGGAPIREAYSFFAKGMDEYVGNKK